MFTPIRADPAQSLAAQFAPAAQGQREWPAVPLPERTACILCFRWRGVQYLGLELPLLAYVNHPNVVHSWRQLWGPVIALYWTKNNPQSKIAAKVD